MRSESTSALGQPSETNPTLGGAAPRARGRAPRSGLVFAAFVLAAVIRGRARRPGLALAGPAAGEIGEGEVAEEIAGLLLQLLLHFHEGVGALLEVAAHQPLHRRA